jgi:hypothetical protein
MPQPGANDKNITEQNNQNNGNRNTCERVNGLALARLTAPAPTAPAADCIIGPRRYWHHQKDHSSIHISIQYRRSGSTDNRMVS